MQLRLYSIKDVKADAFMQPWISANDSTAVRSFADAVRANPNESAIAKYPEDHVLYCLSVWDDNSGVLTPFDAPLSLGVGSSFKDV